MGGCREGRVGRCAGLGLATRAVVIILDRGWGWIYRVLGMRAWWMWLVLEIVEDGATKVEGGSGRVGVDV